MVLTIMKKNVHIPYIQENRQMDENGIIYKKIKK